MERDGGRGARGVGKGGGAAAHQGGAPGGHAGDAEGEVRGGGAELRGAEGEGARVDEGQLHEVRREHEVPRVALRRLAEALEVGALRRDREAEVELGEDELLHLDDLLARVGVVADVDVVADLGGVDLLVLSSEHQRRHPDQLQKGFDQFICKS